MKRNQMKRWGSLLLAFCLLSAGLLTGCGGNGGGGGNATGRYVENQRMELPDTYQIYQPRMTGDGGLQFVSYDWDGEEEDAKRLMMRNLLSPGGVLQRDPIDWANALLDEESRPMDYNEGADGTAYLLYADAKGDDVLYRYHNGMAERLEIEAWNKQPSANSGTTHVDGQEEEPEGEFIIGGMGSVTLYDDDMKWPSSVYALEDGEFLILYSGDGLTRYSADCVELEEYAIPAYDSGVVVRDGILSVENAMTGEITLYHAATGETVARYSDETASSRFDYSMALLGETLYMADQNGIHQVTSAGLETIVDGGLTSLMLPTYRINHMVAAEGGVFYAFLTDEEGCLLMEYVFDESLSAEPEVELNIFSLYENSTIRQAIGVFQRQNPNVRVNFNVALDENSGATTEDVIRALNTEMLGGKSPDLIVLDGMPAASYIEKGVLEDITDLIAQLSRAEGLMDHLTDAYRVGGKLYGTPSRFTLPVMIGDSEKLAAIGSLSDLAGLVEAEQGNNPSLLAIPDELWYEDGGILTKYYDSCVNNFTREDGTLDEKALTAFFSDILRLDTVLKAHAPQIGEDTEYFSVVVSMGGGGSGFEELDMGSWKLRDGAAQVHLQTLVGMLGLRSIGGDLGEMPGMALNSMFGDGVYYPQGSIGVTAAGSRKDLAKAFVETLLSQAVQDKYLYDGFPVNGNSLDRMMEEQLGGEDPVSDMNFRSLCNRLSTPALVDDVVKNAVSEQADSLLGGVITPEEAAANVMERTRLYLAE